MSEFDVPVLPLRACELCEHGGLDLAGMRVCRAPDAMWNRAPVPIEQARKFGGACGPEAALARAEWAKC